MILIVLLLLLGLVILYLVGNKSVRAEIIIDSKPADVWNVLIDVESHKEWNSVLIPNNGDFVEGTRIEYQFIQDETTTSIIPSKVRNIVKNQLLNQAGGMPGILTFNHKYILEEINGNTRLIIIEQYRGIGVPFWNPAPVQKAYERLAQDLKKYMAETKG